MIKLSQEQVLGGIKMKKKISFLVLAFIALVTLSSCSFFYPGFIIPEKTSTSTKTTPTTSTQSTITTDILTLPPYLRGQTVKGHEVSYEFDEDEYQAFELRLTDAKRKCENEVDFNEFYEVYEEAEDFYNLLSKGYKAEYLEYCLYGKDESQENYLTFQNRKTDIAQWYNEVEHMAYKNSFKSLLYPNMSDEEILNQIGNEYPEEYYNINKELDKITADFLSLDDEEDNFETEAEKLTVSYINKANELNPYLGKDYFSYSYEHSYERDYLPENTDNYFKYVMQYTLPAYVNLESSSTRGLTASEKELYNNLYVNKEAFLNCFDEIKAYKDNMGGVIKEAFDNLFTEDGYYYISYDKNGYDGAFQDTFTDGTPYVFYGPGYHDPFTVVHEFGHYTAATKYNGSLCYDLAETQSQSNELLFALDYLNRHNASNNLKKAVINEKLSDFYSTIIIASIVNEVEKYCYAKSPMKTGDIDTAVNIIFNKYHSLSTVYNKAGIQMYCKYVMVYSPAYYISYSTSLIGSLNIYKMASLSFENGKEAYLKLIDYDFSMKNYRDIYRQAGLYDPLSEECFRYIFS